MLLGLKEQPHTTSIRNVTSLTSENSLTMTINSIILFGKYISTIIDKKMCIILKILCDRLRWYFQYSACVAGSHVVVLAGISSGYEQLVFEIVKYFHMANIFTQVLNIFDG